MKRLVLILGAALAAACACAEPQGSAELRAAIYRALDHLAAEQREDGSFDGRYGKTTALPSLAAMACLASGYLPGDPRYGRVVDRSLEYVLSHAEPDGYLGKEGDGRMYAHSISTLFLAEVSGMVSPARQRRIDEVLPKAVKVILDAQNIVKGEFEDGGWRYTPDTKESDTSCSGWALMALRSARLNGAQVPSSAISRAVEYMKRHQDKELGCMGYQDTRTFRQTLSGASILCLELCGMHDSPETRRAARYLRGVFRDEFPEQEYLFYGVYYASQGFFQIGGAPWQEYSEWMHSTILPMQRPDGSWNGRGGEDAPIYATSMAILAFAVPWRQLPVYQRDETVEQ